VDRPNENISIRDAIGIWLNTTNSKNPVQFRDGCYLTHCNEICPEEITFEQDESFLWQHAYEVFTYCIVAMVTLMCLIIKGAFFLWYWRLLHKQKQFLQQTSDIENSKAIYQVPIYVHVCISMLCLNVTVCLHACLCRVCSVYMHVYTIMWFV